MRIKIDNDHKEKHNSWECIIEDNFIDYGYGADEKEAKKNFSLVLKKYIEELNNIYLELTTN